MSLTHVDDQVDLSDPELDEEKDKYTHIVQRGEDGEHAEARVLRAQFEGTPVTALCGHIWVPTLVHEAKKEVCPKCKEMVAFATDMTL